jgi:hypothetical protein
MDKVTRRPSVTAVGTAAASPRQRCRHRSRPRVAPGGKIRSTLSAPILSISSFARHLNEIDVAAVSGYRQAGTFGTLSAGMRSPIRYSEYGEES